jgi:hypothetical protein
MKQLLHNMKAAPVGLSILLIKWEYLDRCFAYAKPLGLYYALGAFYFVVFFSLYALLAGGNGLKCFGVII